MGVKLQDSLVSIVTWQKSVLCIVFLGIHCLIYHGAVQILMALAACATRRRMLMPVLSRRWAGLLQGPGPAWARAEPATPEGPNFGTMTNAGYACAFFDAMEADVVPGLVAIGLPEAEAAYAALLVA